MKTIRSKILLNYILIIVFMFIVSAVMIMVSFSLIGQYQQVNDIIVVEQRLSDTTNGLTTDFYKGYIGNDFSAYDNRVATILTIEKDLETRIAGTGSWAKYLGVKNSLDIIMSGMATVRQKSQSGTLTEDLSSIFSNNSAKFEYVKGNITDLILEEAKSLATVTININKTRTVVIWSVVAVFVLGIAGLVVVAVLLSHSIAEPIVSLSNVAQKVAKGNLNVEVSRDLRHSSDEVNILSESFVTMLAQLRERIKEADNKSKKLEEQNRELEKMNRLMVGREVVMFDLKKQIKEKNDKL